MTDHTTQVEERSLDSATEEFAQQIADGVESFLLAVRAISRGEATGGQAISLLLLVVSQVLLAGGRLGVQADFQPAEEYEPDAGPDPDLDDMRHRLAVLLEGVDAYTEVFDPYVDPPELVSSLLSDDLTSIAASLAHGLRHFKAGRVPEALWWWQFSYVASWGGEASAVLRALQSVVAHDRLDLEFEIEQEAVEAAEEMLDSSDVLPDDLSSGRSFGDSGRRSSGPRKPGVGDRTAKRGAGRLAAAGRILASPRPEP